MENEKETEVNEQNESNNIETTNSVVEQEETTSGNNEQGTEDFTSTINKIKENYENKIENMKTSFEEKFKAQNEVITQLLNDEQKTPSVSRIDNLIAGINEKREKQIKW